MRSYWNLTLSRIFLLVAFPCCAFAQFNDSEVHSLKGSGLDNYLFPINPGQLNQLAGTMGELRNTHFHGGIDIRTNNQIGIPVLATQDGYISRASVSPYGYGTSLYINHPDGKVSLYGHLDRYVGDLAAYVKREQYKRKSFEIELYLRPGMFPVKRGDIVALSGNTGSSEGPHLHFEIREGNFTLNPLKFGFTEIKDDIPPAPKKIALRTLDGNSRINDRFGRFEFTLVRKSPSEFSLPVPILAHGRIGIELLADDRMNDSPGRCGINYIEVFADSQRVFSQTIERIDMDESRGIQALMDFKTLETNGKRYNKLYIDEGNRLEFYSAENKGIISVNEKDRAIRILMKDQSGNTSNARFRLKSNPIDTIMVLASTRKLGIESEIYENFLMVTSRACATSDKLTIYSKGAGTEVNYAYKGANQFIYLINLQKVRPDSARTCSGSLTFQFKDMIPSVTEYTYYSDLANIRFPENSLYDTLFLNVDHRLEKGFEIFTIGQRVVPLHKRAYITLKPTLPWNANKNLAVYRKEGIGYSYIGGDWGNGKVKFSTLQLGDFTFLIDSLAPNIWKIKVDKQSARFRVRDGLSGVAYYEANINGQWLMMNYDYKSGILQSDRLDLKQSLAGDFELKVVDRAGNERIYKQKIL